MELNYFNGGLNVMKPDSEIFNSQAVSCQNVMNNQLVGIDSRYGYSQYYASAITTAQVKSLAIYNTKFSSQFLLSYGSGLYVDFQTSAVNIWSALASAHIRSFEMNGSIYMLDGNNYIGYTYTG